MQRSARPLISILLLVLLSGPVEAQEGARAASPSGSVRLDLRTNSFIDLHFYVRAQGDQPLESRGHAFAEGDAAHEFDAAIDAAAQLE